MADTVNVDAIITTLLATKEAEPSVSQLSEDDVRGLVLLARAVFMSEASLLELDAPIKVCGDIHGQFFDLLRMFEMAGPPKCTRYLFLGNYVNRGRNSLETLCLLLAYKVALPEKVFLLRGNHESASVGREYGFYDDCKRRYSAKLWLAFNDMFNCMPVAAVVGKKIFCVHSGLSPDLHTVEQIRSIRRPTEVPDSGLLCDLLWAEPCEDTNGWGDNPVSYKYGPDIVDNFLATNGFDLVCRAHHVAQHGYQFFARRSLVTVFSAPNYCGEYDNAGAFMSIDSSLMCSFTTLPVQMNGEKGSPKLVSADA